MFQDIDIAFLENQHFPDFENLDYFSSLHNFNLKIILGLGSELRKQSTTQGRILTPTGKQCEGKLVQCYKPGNRLMVPVLALKDGRIPDSSAECLVY